MDYKLANGIGYKIAKELIGCDWLKLTLFLVHLQLT